MNTKINDRCENYAVNQEKLLRLIDEGDPSSILSEENTKGFNELMKYQLITIEDDKVSLTELGREAINEGILKVMEKAKEPTILVNALNSPIKVLPKNRKVYYASLLFFLLMLLAFLISRLTSY